MQQLRQIPLVGLALPIGEGNMKNLQGTNGGSIRSFSTRKIYHVETITLDLMEERDGVLIGEGIDFLTVHKIDGECNLYLNEVTENMKIPIDSRFSYEITVEKLYVSNSGQSGHVVILLDRYGEGGEADGITGGNTTALTSAIMALQTSVDALATRTAAIESKKSSFEFVQSTPAAVWNIRHNLGAVAVDITAFDTNGEQIVGKVDMEESTANLLVYKFSEAVAGKAYIDL